MAVSTSGVTKKNCFGYHKLRLLLLGNKPIICHFAHFSGFSTIQTIRSSFSTVEDMNLWANCSRPEQVPCNVSTPTRPTYQVKLDGLWPEATWQFNCPDCSLIIITNTLQTVISVLTNHALFALCLHTKYNKLCSPLKARILCSNHFFSWCHVTVMRA